MAALGLLVLAVPGNQVVVNVAAENPSASNVFAGDAVASATVGTGTRLFAFRLANDDSAASHRAGWEANPGASVTGFFRTWTTGISPPAAPNGNSDDVCAIRLYQDNSATNQRTIHAATTCPSTGTSFVVYCTHNGQVTGNPIAGTLRFVVAVEDRTAGVPVYSVDSDSGSGHARGAIRCGLDATAITPSAYPTGSTYAYTVAGEAFTVDLASTQRAGGQTAPHIQFRLHDTGGQFATTANVLLDIDETTTSTAFTVSDSFPAAAVSVTVRVVITGISGLTGVKFTHMTTPTSPLGLVDDATVELVDAFNVDPRITATHLLLLDDATFATPPMSEDAGTTRQNDETGRIATRFTNARGEGLAGAALQFTQSIQDNGATLPGYTITGQSVSTQGGEAGWGPLQLWNDGAPLGDWVKVTDVTAPASIDSNAHLISAAIVYELDGGGGIVHNEQADPLLVYTIPNNPILGQPVLLVTTARYMDGTARVGAALDLDIDISDATGLLVDDANPTEASAGVYTYEYVTTSLDVHLVIVATLHPDTMEPITIGNGFHVQPVPVEAGDILAVVQHINSSLEEHRMLSPEYTMEEVIDARADTIGQFVFLLFVLYFGLTRLIPNKWIRFGSGFLGMAGLFALRIPEDQVPIIFTLQVLVLLYDSYCLFYRE